MFPFDIFGGHELDERERLNHECQQAEIERLRAALEPFAAHAKQVETLHPGWYHEGFEYSVGLPMKWFIEARNALAGERT